MGIEHHPILIVAWIDAKGKSDLIESLEYLYGECHLDRGGFTTLTEADANFFLGLMKRHGVVVPILDSRRLLE